MIRKHNEVYFEYNSKIEKLKEKIKLKKLENEKEEDFDKRLKEHKLNMSQEEKKTWSWIKKVEDLLRDTYLFEKNLKTRNYEYATQEEFDRINQTLIKLENFSFKSRENCKSMRDYLGYLAGFYNSLKPVINDYFDFKKGREERRQANIDEYNERQKQKMLNNKSNNSIFEEVE